MTVYKIAALTAAVLFTLAAAQAQVLLTTTAGSAKLPGSTIDDFFPADVLAFDAAIGGPVRHQATHHNLESIIGDADGNGIYDDAPESIDALCSPAPGLAGDVLGFMVSFSKNTAFTGGVNVLDGDVVLLMPSGQVLPAYSESHFANATSTSSIDVDALHLLDDGTLLFSFADDENTTDPNLIAQNGGDPRLDETIVFQLPPGAATANILFTRSDVVAYVSTALGTTITTVVDTTGVTADPENPGELLLTFGSANSALEGTVFSTAAGGIVASLGGHALDSGTLGFDEQEVLGSLVTMASRPYELHLAHPDTRATPPGTVRFDIFGATPAGTIALFLAWTEIPTPVSATAPGLGAAGQVYLDLGDPLFNATISHPGFRRGADVNGEGCFTFTVQGIQPGVSFTFQAFDLTAFAASLPVTATA